MRNFEVFQFWCCGVQLQTDAERKVKCPKCEKNYQVVFGEGQAGNFAEAHVV